MDQATTGLQAFNQRIPSIPGEGIDVQVIGGHILKMKNLFVFIFLFTITNGMAQNDVIMRQYAPSSAKYGVIDTSGRVTVPFEYTQILPYRNGVACASKPVNHKFLEDNTVTGKRIIVEPAYHEIWGLIDHNGNVLIPFIYLRLQNGIAGNRFIALDKEQKWGVTGKNNETVIPFEYSRIWEYQDLFFCKHVEKAYLILDMNGQVVNSTGYDEISYDVFLKAYIVKKNGKEGIVDLEGQEIVPCRFDKLGSRGWNDGLLCVSINKKWGFIDNTSDLIVPCVYKKESFFIDGIASVETEDGQRMAIDKKGRIIHHIPFGIHGYFGDKAYITREVYIKQGDRSASFKAALVGNGLNNITPFEYGKIYRLSDKAYLVSRDDKLFGIINETGKEILPVKYEMPNSLMTVGDKYIWLKQNGKFGLIDFTGHGKKVFGFEFDDVNHILISKNGKWGAFDLRTGKMTIPIRYDTIKNLWGWSFMVTTDHKCGILDISGQVIVPVIYDEIKDLKSEGASDWYLLRKGDRYGLLNSLSNMILECRYHKIGFIVNLNMRNSFITAGLNGSTEILRVSEQGFERVASVNDPFIPQSVADDFIIVSNSGKTGVLDIQGKEVIPCGYSDIPSYSDGYFVVREADDSTRNGKEVIYSR